jgi:hypothetical protein
MLFKTSLHPRDQRAPVRPGFGVTLRRTRLRRFKRAAKGAMQHKTGRRRLSRRCCRLSMVHHEC